MSDPLLWLTPVLAFAVLALARFVGCQLVFEAKPGIEIVEFVESAVLGPSRADFTGWVGMAIRVGQENIKVTALGRTSVVPITAPHDVKLVRPVGTDGADLGVVTLAPSSGAGEFAYATLAAPVTLEANQTYFLVSHEVAGGDAFSDVLGTTVTTTDVAAVTSGVFNDDADPRFQQAGGPGNTYGPVDFRYEALL